MPKSFWGEALSTAAHLVNRSPSTALNFKCPEEKWTSRKLNFNYLRVFGCEAYAHKLEGKLEPRSIKCVFIGYQEGTKGFRLWERQSGGRRIIISRDVIFSEAIFPYKTENTEHPNTPWTSDDFDILGGSQIEVEQAAGNVNLPTAPIEFNPENIPIQHENHTSDHDDDQEKQEDDTDTEVEHQSSPPRSQQLSTSPW